MEKREECYFHFHSELSHLELGLDHQGVEEGIVLVERLHLVVVGGGDVGGDGELGGDAVGGVVCGGNDGGGKICGLDRVGHNLIPV